MKISPPSGEPPRFSGSLKHYHRSGVQNPKTWDQWVDGDSASAKPRKNWLKIIGIIAGTLALGAIIAALVIQLRLF